MNVSVSQAMACGLPVITTRHSGLPEQVADGITGLVVPEGDVQALTTVLAELINHPERWGAMGRAGRERVAQRYNQDALIDRLCEIYSELMS